MNVNAIIDHCLGLGFFDLQNYAGANYQTVYYHIRNNHPGTNANDLLIPTIFTCVAANGSLSESETDFIIQFIGGYTRDQAFETAGEFYCEEAQNIVRELCRTFPANVYEAFVSLCIAVLCVDKRLDGDEVAFLKTLL